MSAIRSWKLVVAGLAAAVVIGGGVGMTLIQLRAGDANEPGPPNIDTRTWVSERGDGFLLRRPEAWYSRRFDDLVGNRLRSAGVLVANKEHDFRVIGTAVTRFLELPSTLAAVRVVLSSGGPVPIASKDPDTSFPLALEQAEVDRGRSTGGVMVRVGLRVRGVPGWAAEAWIGNDVSRVDAEIVRRVFSSIGFPALATGGLTLEEQMIAHEIAESYKGARTALKGRPHTHPDFATDQTGSAKCGGHKCALVVFQITGGLRFRVLVDLVERRAIAFS